MTQNPIRKVLSTLRSRQVRFLLIGGQACIFYGAAEFSRDTDIIILAESENLRKLSEALNDLRAECIAVPPLSEEYLKRGHAIHFRCYHPEAQGIRVDIISVLRGVSPFKELWLRRTTVETESGEKYDLISLPDLVQSKKTQRDKDWPMIRRLIEAYYVQNYETATPEQIDFLLRELRTTALLVKVANDYPAKLATMIGRRPLLKFAKSGKEDLLAEAIATEENLERKADLEYWKPLKAELEKLRLYKKTK